ncbi:hypothetical protein INT47_000272 [Mucor saturninus]|uniref:NmrA-like domain-containing protein n=1 Tax=Mucor saturninus TaxID=64648 RepID=A0A8H7QWT8_9FUNG|nr:hypothetical protein INT47_000272 [Mucor saturninus]
MSSIPSETISKPKYILITNGESYVGHSLAIFIADQLVRKEGQLKKNWRVRVLCEDKKKLQDLEKKGIEVKEVDYEGQAVLRDQMKGQIKTMICNPFSQNDDRLIHRGKNLIDAAIHNKIKRIMMISMMGCSFSEDKETPAGQFNLLEEHLRNCFKYGDWVVFRIPMIQQFMYFWSSMIENKSVIGMPIAESNMLTTVNIKDVCECICQAALSKKCIVWGQTKNDDVISDGSSSNSEYVTTHTTLKRVYGLTSDNVMTLTMIAQALSDALKEAGFSSDVEPATITREQLESYLKFVSEEPAEDKVESFLTIIFPDIIAKKRNISTGGLLSNFRSLFIGSEVAKPCEMDDPNWYPSPPRFLTPFCIQVILDHLNISRQPEIPMLPSSDVRDITGRKPIDLSSFFMKNRRQFRPEFVN